MTAITRHAAHPVHAGLTLCAREIAQTHGALTLRPNPPPLEICDVGLQVSCPDCRVVINFCRKCIAPSGYTCVRAA